MGWTMVPDEHSARLRHELHRRWLMWHDEAVRGGITDARELREILIGRQRQWENTPHPAADGRTPKQVLMELDRRMIEALSRQHGLR